MPTNGPKEQVAWDLDWEDLTGGAPAPAPAPPPVAAPPIPVAATAPPPLPHRAFPTPAAIFPASEPEAIVPVQHLPSPVSAPASSTANPSPVRSPVPAPASRGLVRGQRIKLSEILAEGSPPAFDVALTFAATAGQTLDLSCFGLDDSGKLSDDRYFIFYNQKVSPEGALSLGGPGGNVFQVNLSRLPTAVRRLVFAATIDGAGSVRALGQSRFELRGGDGRSAAHYDFSGTELDEVKALMIAEVYFKEGIWRLAAVGQGFGGGLGELLRHFGGQEI